MTKRALVTGSHGFIGRHLWPHLERLGYEVTLVDLKRPDLAPEVQGDALRLFRDYVDLAGDPGYYDLVVHLAANIGGRAAIDGEPHRLLVEDLELDVALFAWARRAHPGRILYFSSSAVYPVELQDAIPRVDLGHGAAYRLPESATGRGGNPDNTYGFTKLVGERLAHEARLAGQPITVVRPFSGYGGDQDPDYPFRAILDRAFARKDPFPIWGPGTQARDFIHVDDVVHLAVHLAIQGIDGPVNLGTGRATDFLTLAGLIIDQTREWSPSYNPVLEPDEDAPTGTLWRVANTKILNELVPGYRFTTIEEGIAQALHDREPF